MIYLWLALPLAVSVAISLLAQFERKRLHREPLPPELGEWLAAPGEPGWERRVIVVPGSLLLGNKLTEQRRRRHAETGKICELAPERVLRRVR